jgi:hypothetical protein
MSDLTYGERVQLEKLLGMGSGYVLDFSNRTFQEFVYESVNIDIFERRFEYQSGSKANRLRAVWKVESNPIAGKLIVDLCAHYKTSTQEPNSELLSVCADIGSRLLGRTAAGPRQPAAQRRVEDPAVEQARLRRIGFDSLLRMFDEMNAERDHQRRGYRLQDLLNDLFRANGIPMTKPFTRNNGAEQIDGAFKFDAWHYIAECRWREQLADTRQLDGLLGQVGRSGKQTMGLFLSINGWSLHVPPLLKQNGNKCIVLVDGYDLRCVLEQQIDLAELLNAKLTHLNIEAEPFLSAATIIAGLKR